jgi:predicted DNA-binding transcriptional regulator AlpA
VLGSGRMALLLRATTAALPADVSAGGLQAAWLDRDGVNSDRVRPAITESSQNASHVSGRPVMNVALRAKRVLYWADVCHPQPAPATDVMSLHSREGVASPEAYVTREQLAVILGVSLSTIDRMRARGMPYRVFGRRAVRFRLSEVLAWPEERAA